MIKEERLLEGLSVVCLSCCEHAGIIALKKGYERRGKVRLHFFQSSTPGVPAMKCLLFSTVTIFCDQDVEATIAASFFIQISTALTTVPTM